MGGVVTLVVGILLMAIGGVWFFQGIGSLAGSPMTGVSFWAYAGGAAFIVGVALLDIGVCRSKSRAK